MADCPGQIWDDCPTRRALATERERYREAALKIAKWVEEYRGTIPDGLLALVLDLREAFDAAGSV